MRNGPDPAHAFFFGGSPEARWMRNLRANPRTSIHLESPAEVLVIEGRAEEVVPDRSLAERLAAAASKYGDRYGVIPAESYIGRSLWALRPSHGYGWTDFPRNATTWLFPHDDPVTGEAEPGIAGPRRETTTKTPRRKQEPGTSVGSVLAGLHDEIFRNQPRSAHAEVLRDDAVAMESKGVRVLFPGDPEPPISAEEPLQSIPSVDEGGSGPAERTTKARR